MPTMFIFFLIEGLNPVPRPVSYGKAMQAPSPYGGGDDKGIRIDKDINNLTSRGVQGLSQDTLTYNAL